MIKYKNILIDANNLFYRNYEKLNHMTYEVGEATIIVGGIYGSMRSVWKLQRDYLEKNHESRVYILFDNAKSKENMRKEVDPTYKLNRESKPQTFYRSLDYFRYMLLNSSPKYTVVYGTGYEADDIAPVILDVVERNRPSLVVSEDLDWSRLIGYQGSTVHHYMKNEVYDEKYFNKKYNFEPSESRITMYKAIRGDVSDNIPVGVRGIQEKTVLRIIDDYKDVYDLLENLDIIDYITPRMKAKIREAMPRLKLNHQLVSFIPLKHGDIENCIHEGEFNPRVLNLIYESLGFDVEKFDSRVAKRLNVSSSTEDDFFIRPKKKHI